MRIIKNSAACIVRLPKKKQQQQQDSRFYFCMSVFSRTNEKTPPAFPLLRHLTFLHNRERQKKIHLQQYLPHVKSTLSALSRSLQKHISQTEHAHTSPTRALLIISMLPTSYDSCCTSSVSLSPRPLSWLSPWTTPSHLLY